MHTVTKEYTFEAAHRLMDYIGPCANIHGHSYKVHVTVAPINGLTPNGMALDFKELKAAMAVLLDQWDHAIILRADDPLWDVLKGRTAVMRYPWNPTAENMAQHIFRVLHSRVPDDVRVVSVKVWETATSFAEYTADAR